MKKGQTTAVAAIVRAVIGRIEWAKIDRGVKRTEIVGQLGDRG
jgi:hypothetical protein